MCFSQQFEFHQFLFKHFQQPLLYLIQKRHYQSFWFQDFVNFRFFQQITRFLSLNSYLIRKRQCLFFQPSQQFQKCKQFRKRLLITLNKQLSKSSQLSRKHDRETRPGNAEGKLLHGTPHPAFDAGKPCRPRTKPRQASKLALRRYHAPQSPQCLTGRPWRRLRTGGQGDCANRKR